MSKISLVNIHNKGRKIFLFVRDFQGNLTIQEDNSFFPYYYELCDSGNCLSFDGKRLKKLYTTEPKEVAKIRTKDAYEADIIFTRRYLIDKIDEITSGKIKYAFIDIEVLANELPNVQQAKYPISCISIYNSANKQVKTFFLADYKDEKFLHLDFLKYMQIEKFDLWLSWNVKFDYNYLFYRIPDFDKLISPLRQSRYGDGEVFYPAGMSIIDYLAWFKKVTLNKEKSYALDEVAQKYFQEKAWGKTKFGELSEDIKRKNINDVIRMSKLEEKFKLIPYFDEIRRLSKTDWEDLIWNSRIVDSLLLQEAKNQKIVLPMKPKDNEKEEFEGAYREAYELGAHFGIGKYDLSSAYPFAIINFCLDPANITTADEPEAIKVDETYFAQNETALLPTIVKRLVNLKNHIKQNIESMDLNNPALKDLKTKYDAIKAVVNSTYGSMAMQYFRLYNRNVASATTFLVRDLLHYVKDNIESQGYKVIYVDTDSVFIQSDVDLTSQLNLLVQEWAMNKYGKQSVNIEFAFEGVFERLLILAKCRYIGYRRTKKGIEEEIKGVEVKRKDSTAYMRKYQRELIDKILNKETKESIYQWIQIEVEKFKTLPLTDIAIPCKLAKNPKEYKNVPIVVRALNETEGFSKKVGDSFYYIYVEPESYTIDKPVTEYYREIPGKKEGKTKKVKLTLKDLKEIKNLTTELNLGTIKKEDRIKTETKYKDVKAFDEDTVTQIKNIDYNKMINRNIWNKTDVIFKAMGWNLGDLNPDYQEEGEDNDSEE